MSNLPVLSNESLDDDTPLPLIVAKRWSFPLTYIVETEETLYAIQDWIRGLTGEKDIHKLWSYFKKQNIWNQMSS